MKKRGCSFLVSRDEPCMAPIANWKTKMCALHAKQSSAFVDRYGYLPSQQGQVSSSSGGKLEVWEKPPATWRTSMCGKIERKKNCPFGHTCQWAHSRDQLRHLDDPFPENTVIYTEMRGAGPFPPPTPTVAPAPHHHHRHQCPMEPDRQVKVATRDVIPEMCMICVDRMSDQRWLPCGHMGCSECLHNWRNESVSKNVLGTRCHLCRNKVTGHEMLGNADPHSASSSCWGDPEKKAQQRTQHVGSTLTSEEERIMEANLRVKWQEQQAAFEQQELIEMQQRREKELKALAQQQEMEQQQERARQQEQERQQQLEQQQQQLEQEREREFERRAFEQEEFRLQQHRQQLDQERQEEVRLQQEQEQHALLMAQKDMFAQQRQRELEQHALFLTEQKLMAQQQQKLQELLAAEQELIAIQQRREREAMIAQQQQQQLEHQHRVAAVKHEQKERLAVKRPPPGFQERSTPSKTEMRQARELAMSLSMGISREDFDRYSLEDNRIRQEQADFELAQKLAQEQPSLPPPPLPLLVSQEGNWFCAVCTFENGALFPVCAMCDTVRNE